MKLFQLALLVLPFPLFAQDTVKKPIAIGILGESNEASSSGTTPSISAFGMQYKKNYKKHLSYQANLGYGYYTQVPSNNLRSISGDTATSRKVNARIGMVVAGFGLEGERQFYRKVRFFAGVELRAGYGSGTTDTVITRYYNSPRLNPNGTYSNYIASSDRIIKGIDETLIYGALKPYIGVKLEYRKFSFGMAVMNPISYIRLQPDGKAAEATIYYDSNNLTRRFFLLYKL